MSTATSLNSLSVTGQGRQPRGLVSINGNFVNWISFEVDNNTYYLADTFRVDLPLKGQPQPFTWNYWSTQESLLVEIFAGFPADPNHFTKTELDSLLLGQVDDVDIDPVNGVVTLSGRDLTARFIDAKTTEKFQNQTASQIAVLLAQRRELTPMVVPTTTKVGTYYEIDHARLTTQKSEWDLLTYLAQGEEFNVYVKGQNLYFQPKPSQQATPYVLQWQPPNDGQGFPTFNGTSINFSRNLTLAKDVIVEVRSWNAKQKKAFTQKATATHNANTVTQGAAQPMGEAQVYTYVMPGLTAEQALQKAQQLAKEITLHEKKLHAVLPADNSLNTTMMIQVKGTHSSFDQLYYPDSIVRAMNLDEGYKMTIEAKNHAVDTQILV